MEKKILVSGVKPTGRPHLGNYFGAMKQFVELQNEYDSYIFLANLHALTTIQDGETLRELSRELLLDYLAIGIDPENVVIFNQSDVKQHAELGWIFNCITTMPYLMRAHSFKDAEAKNKDINVGVFDYPMLMAADILLYGADVVPVGKDQKQHIEFTRDTAQKFNSIFGETFQLPKALILESTETIPGTDGQKMSKSYGNTIPLFGTDDEIKTAVMSIVTGSNPKNTPNDPTDTLFTILELFLNDDDTPYVRGKYESGEMGYKETKERLITEIIEFVEPLRKRRAEFARSQTLLDEILRQGAARARARAEGVMEIVRHKVGI
ncbi:MAG: tryptophan--tRNA ligase [Candidatus Nomurabacteria bacterium]|nr:tryptophan--tRNA ligase [Candidatus Nomurabacteria bacterium]